MPIPVIGQGSAFKVEAEADFVAGSGNELPVLCHEGENRGDWVYRRRSFSGVGGA
jgi:hypothetical protein